MKIPAWLIIALLAAGAGLSITGRIAGEQKQAQQACAYPKGTAFVLNKVNDDRQVITDLCDIADALVDRGWSIDGYCSSAACDREGALRAGPKKLPGELKGDRT